MVHAIIYDNIPEKGGWNLYGRTPDFPVFYEAEIQHVGECFRAGNGKSETTAIRYAPLKDKYLLSWVLRHPVSETEGCRAYHSVVNFLLDPEDADKMFRIPFSSLHGQIDRIAGELWKHAQEELPNHWQLVDAPAQKQEKQKDLCDVEDYILLAGGFYGASGKLRRQLYLKARDPWEEISWLQSFIPARIQKNLSFCIGLESLQESEGVALNFPTNVPLSQLRKGMTGDGVPMSNKYWHGEDFKDPEMKKKCEQILDLYSAFPKSIRRLLGIVVENWHAFGLLASQRTPEKALQELMLGTRESCWLDALDAVNPESKSLKMLEKAIPRGADYKKLERALKARLKTPVYDTVSQPGRYVRTQIPWERTPVRNDEPYIDEPPRIPQKPERHQKESDGVGQLLLKQTKRTVCVVSIVIALIAFLTFLRQTVLFEAGVTGMVIWLSVARETAVDAGRLMGTFLSGIVVGGAGIKLLQSFKK